MEMVEYLKEDIWIRKDFDPTGLLIAAITSTKKGAEVYEYIIDKEEEPDWDWADSVEYFKGNHPVVKEKSFQYWNKLIDTKLRKIARQ